MTHEGRMFRGEEKLSKGINDIETEYFLKNKVEVTKVEEEVKPKEVKNAKSNK